MSAGAELIVWRHGRTEWNDTGRFQGQLDPPLDDVGHAQARAAAAALASLRPRTIVSSDLARARDTAAYLGEACDLPVALDPRLREVDVGEWSGLTRAELAEHYPDALAGWLRGEDVRRAGGETLAELQARVVAAAAEHAAAPAPVVLVTHGGAARSLLAGLLGLPGEASAAFAALANAHWAALRRHPRGWCLAAYNVGREVEDAEGGRDDGTPVGPVL